MQVLGLIWGICAVLGMIIAFVPLLGWLNWLNIPFSVVGLIIGVLALKKASSDQKTMVIVGIVLCSAAAFFGFIRLVLGAGVV